MLPPVYYDYYGDSVYSRQWLLYGTLYMAALKACEQMAIIVEDQEAANNYRAIWTVGVKNQNEQLWNEKLGHYAEKSEFLEIKGKRMKVMTNATNIDMLLGQWWANQLNLGQLYPVDRTKQSLAKIYTNKMQQPMTQNMPRMN